VCFIDYYIALEIRSGQKARLLTSRTLHDEPLVVLAGLWCKLDAFGFVVDIAKLPDLEHVTRPCSLQIPAVEKLRASGLGSVRAAGR
jgi:hypothetical protein